MKPLLNTLYVLTPDAYLRKERENVVILQEERELFRIPVINLEAIVCFNYMGASPGVMQLCVDHGVSLCFLTPRGRFIASISGPVRGNVLLRRTQYRVADDELLSTTLAARFIAGKMANSRAVLSRYCRDHHPEGESLEQIRKVMGELRLGINQLRHLSARASVMGTEGHAAKSYFSVFGQMILNDRFTFTERSKRPPRMRSMHCSLFSTPFLPMMSRVPWRVSGLIPMWAFCTQIAPVGRHSPRI